MNVKTCQNFMSWHIILINNFIQSQIHVFFFSGLKDEVEKLKKVGK